MSHLFCEQQISRDFILNSGEKMYQADTRGSLSLFCYEGCESEDSDSVKQCRSVVFDGNRLVSRSFPFTDEYVLNPQTEEKLRTRLGDMQNMLIFNSHEGCIIRVFHHSDEWFATTNRKFDSYKSHWGSSKSFGEMFDDALRATADGMFDAEDVRQTLFERLDKHFTYLFLVSFTSDNRLVNDAPERPRVFHVGTYDEQFKLCLDVDVGVPFTGRVNVGSVNELFCYVSELSPREYQGVICFETNGKQFKIYNSVYHELLSLRDNVASIPFRYLQIRSDPELNRRFRLLYPERVITFDTYELALRNTALFVIQSYMDRFVRKQRVVVPPEEHHVMQQLHKWYFENPNTNRVSMDVSIVERVMGYINRADPPCLNQMIHHRLDGTRNQTAMERATTLLSGKQQTSL